MRESTYSIWEAAFVLTILMFAGFLFFSAEDYRQTENCQELVQEEGYGVYLNGERIDGEKMDFHQYSVSIDHDKKEIYLAFRGTGSTHNVMPVFFPR